MDNINHYGPVRLRVTGSGQLDMRYIALAEDPTTENPPDNPMGFWTMQTSTYILPSILGNFVSQYAQLELSVDVIDEYFLINKIVMYVRPIFKTGPMT